MRKWLANNWLDVALAVSTAGGVVFAALTGNGLAAAWAAIAFAQVVHNGWLSRQVDHWQQVSLAAYDAHLTDLKLFGRQS